MAEVIAALGVVASVAQLADYGFKLSVKLYSFGESVYSADKSIKTISNDVSLTSTVLKELCFIIESDEEHVVSNNALEATRQTVNECLAVFQQLNDALDKSLGNMGILEKSDKKAKVKRGTVALEKLKWPFKQSKMELLRSNLDRLKASLTLMLQVLSYARDLSSRKLAESSMAYQQHLIESLARSERTTKRSYLALQKAIEDGETQQIVHRAINKAVQITTTEGVTDPPHEVARGLEPNAPIVRHDTRIAELLLCFRLLNHLLAYNATARKQDDLPPLEYDELRSLIENLYLSHITRIEADYVYKHPQVQEEAAKNVQDRLRELTEGASFSGRSYKPVPPPPEAKRPKMKGAWSIPEARREQSSARSGDSYLSMENLASPLASAGESQVSLSPEKREAAIQAEIEATKDIMQANIDKILARGEKLDDLPPPDFGHPTSQSQAFYEAANRARRQRDIWTRAYDEVVRLGSKGIDVLQGLSGSIIETATGLFSEGGQEWTAEYDPDRIQHSLRDEYGKESDVDDDVEDEFEDENVVNKLLSEWTNLPSQHSSETEQE